MTALTFTYDLEDSRPSSDVPERFTRITERVLDFLDIRGIRGTFFVVGDLGAANPGLVAAIASRGHEIGLHGWRHIPLDRVDRQEFPDAVRRGKAALEDAAGAAVTGFRAPIFSLAPKTEWAIDGLRSAGFLYSSSVLPAPSPLYGFPGAPRTPFRWPSGLGELPCPLAGRGSASVPFLGGVYLRYLPLPLVLKLAGGLPSDAVPWIYCHPYDFDPDEPFAVMPHTGWLTSRILHYRRRGTFGRVERLLDRCGAAPPLRDRLSGAWPRLAHASAGGGASRP